VVSVAAVNLNILSIVATDTHRLGCRLTPLTPPFNSQSTRITDMGRSFRVYLAGESVFVCRHCNNHLAVGESVLSKVSLGPDQRTCIRSRTKPARQWESGNEMSSALAMMLTSFWSQMIECSGYPEGLRCGSNEIEGVGGGWQCWSIASERRYSR
jgi:hypothetical protein